MPNRNKYALIYYDRLTDGHINLMWSTGLNITRENILISTPTDPLEKPLCLVKWDFAIAEQIPEALAAIQEILDEGVTIMTEQEMQIALASPDSPFYQEPV